MSPVREFNHTHADGYQITEPFVADDQIVEQAMKA